MELDADFHSDDIGFRYAFDAVHWLVAFMGVVELRQLESLSHGENC